MMRIFLAATAVCGALTVPAISQLVVNRAGTKNRIGPEVNTQRNRLGGGPLARCAAASATVP
jgi:hypothetical protein